jgi:hypothetical protein
MFGDDRFDLIVARKATLACRSQAAIDAGELRRRRMIFTLAQFPMILSANSASISCACSGQASTR